jgi:endonuclease III
VKSAADHGRKLKSLLRKIPAAEERIFPDANDPVAALVQSFLLADATVDKALAAYAKLRESVVDFNDLRISMPEEIAGLLGPRYPRGLDRCERLRAVLRNIYVREHEMRMTSISSTGKREVKSYIESLEGITPFVAARVMLLSFDVHAIPVDDQLRARLVDEGVADAEADVAEIASWLTRQVKAGEGRALHARLQAWVEADEGAKPVRKGAERGAGKRPSSAKKKTSSASSTGS